MNLYVAKRYFCFIALIVMTGAVQAQDSYPKLQDKNENSFEQEKESKRLEELRRIQRMASQGPSQGPSYADQIRQTFKSNMQFDWPATTVEIRMKSNGEIIEQRIVKSSGNPSFDEAVLKAISKTQKIPPDKDGRVPPSLIIQWSLN
jgi:colicin import membrane protein